MNLSVRRKHLVRSFWMTRKHIGIVLALAVSLVGGPTVVSAAQLPAAALSTHANVTLAPAKTVKQTTAKLNLRKGASTSTASLALIPKGTTLSIRKVSGKWHQVTYKSKTGWVSGDYLKTVAPAQPKVYNYTTGYTTVRSKASSSSSAILAVQRRTKVEVLGKSGSWVRVKVSGKTGYVPGSTLAKTSPSVVNRWVNGKQKVFVTASTSSKNLTTVASNTKVEWLRTSGSWQQVKTTAGIGWIPSKYLSNKAIKPPVSDIKPTTPKPPTPLPPTLNFSTPKWTTSAVNVRAAAGTNYKSQGVIPAGEKVLQARAADGWANVKTSKGAGWVSERYLTATQNKPEENQYRWTSGNVNLRTGNGTTYAVIDVVPAGEKVTFLESKGGWARVVSSKGTGWISESLLSKTAVATLQPDTLAVINAVRARYSSAISSIGGIRPGSVGHSAGKAADIMIKDYRSPASVAKGDDMAQFLINNRASLGISYLIWQDKIWLGPARGWEEYSKSGKYGQQFVGNWNDTTLHMDHIHAETYGNSGTRAPLTK
ncbi:SH3 domain-containing protein [Paeniglutamicibacter sp. R2-26]|uniref:SH3 domain-containing protein n=1 Tax=Paeniglutamicibacter sp. R2-26 TaxID=3144417 RepID=UPI003EE439E3